jgi:hypothetical protein
VFLSHSDTSNNVHYKYLRPSFAWSVSSMGSSCTNNAQMGYEGTPRVISTSITIPVVGCRVHACEITGVHRAQQTCI